MNLYFLRHAKAAARDSTQFPDDTLRPLIPEGEKRMRRGATAMREMELSFDLILSSPWLRAKQTAQIVADVLEAQKKLHFSDALKGDAAPELIIAELRATHRKLDSVLVVGHEPHLSSAISLLLLGNESLPFHFRKGGLCKLTVDWQGKKPTAILDWALTPKQLNGMANS
jgi:phosphohistidine phosphatase